jgi:hypothetical protein
MCVRDLMREEWEIIALASREEWINESSWGRNESVCAQSWVYYEGEVENFWEVWASLPEFKGSEIYVWSTEMEIETKYLVLDVRCAWLILEATLGI